MKTIHIVQLGNGVVGKEIIQQAFQKNANQQEVQLKYIGLANSKGCLLATAGLSAEDLRNFQIQKAAHDTLDYDLILKTLATSQIENICIIDTTASTAVIPFLLNCAAQKYTLVLANKKPLVQSIEIFQKLKATQLGARATVGAGLPVIPAIKALKEKGATLKIAKGCMSGSLGILCSQLEEGIPFSKALHYVSSAGYTEPDPREDLSGEDLLRKMTIITRFAGHKGDFSQVTLSPMLPEDMSSYSIHEFVHRSNHFDAYFKQIYKEANEEGNTLKFVAEYGHDAIRVGLKSVALDSPIGRLENAQKMIELTTHTGEKIIIEGNGSGAKTAAQNVLEDVLELLG